MDYYARKATFYNIIIESLTVPRFQCKLYYGLLDVSFVNSTVEELPKQLFDSFNGIQIANLTRSGIKYVNRYSLERAQSLQVLDVSWNALSELTANCFSGATALTKLVLSYNNISSIDNMAFISLINLRILLLTGNKLRSLDSNVFNSLVALETVYLDSNKLEVIERDLFAKNVKLQNILLQNNSISVAEHGAFNQPSNLSILSLSNNNLTKLNLSAVEVKKVYLANNKLEEIYLSPSMELVSAGNNRIASILMDNSSSMNLTTLDLDNNSITSFESIAHLPSLVNLFLSNNRIGPLNLTSFAKFTKLEQLGLERTFISNLQHGTFAQQESLKWLDLSYNNLDRFDFDILTSSTALETIFLDGNRLKSVNFQYLKKTFPSLVKIGLSDNNWNCTYLIELVRYCTAHSIALFQSQSSVQNQTNVKGIYCYDDKNPLANWNVTMQQMQLLHPHLNSSTEDGALQSLLQSVLEDVRRFSDSNADVANQTTKLDGAVYDLTRNQFALQKDLNSLRQSLFEIRLALMSNRTNGSAGVDNNELRRMIETANNLTLDKQELSAKTLEFKIYEQTFKVDKALELAKENSDKIALVAKGKGPCNYNVADFSGVSLQAQNQQQQQQLLQQSAAHVSGGSGEHGLIITIVVMLCLLMGVIVFGFFKFNRRLFNVERNRYANRDSSLATIIHENI
ncbi:protein artichoke-like [Anopheles marshallii]|uniref:protein artichoke-like n=1 Tax=Anopheles marshallii TaxID=1521116 RepID=UPI00237ABE3F|nr:protein artichoke-like [Anopheles marshallii]